MVCLLFARLPKKEKKTLIKLNLHNQISNLSSKPYIWSFFGLQGDLEKEKKRKEKIKLPYSYFQFLIQI
jgi:hypothetical protein